MNTKYCILAVSAIALLHPSASFATSQKSANEVRAEEATTGHITTDAKEAWKDVKKDAAHASKEIKAFFVGEDEKVPAKEISYARASSASGIIGSAVYNGKKERVGTVKDIIVDSKGKADAVVIADGEFPGFDGKLVALPFADITKKEPSGDVVAPLTEEDIKAAAEFNYEPGTGKTKVRYVPEGGYSVAKILDGDVLSSTKEKVGSVDDVYFKGGDASVLIIGFDKIVGLGGKNVAAEFAPATVIKDGSTVDVQLSAKQSASLASYKTSVAGK